MVRRSFIGNAGRPFGTVAALLCLLLTVAAIVLGDVARDMTGSASPFDVAAPGRVEAMRSYWGLLLASEIVRSVTGLLILLAVWTLHRPVGAKGAGGVAALAAGSLGAVLVTFASRQGIEAAAWLSEPRLSSWGDIAGAALACGTACLGIWAALTAFEARMAGSLPRWVQFAGLLLAACCFAAALWPPALVAAAGVSLAWWGGVFATLYKPGDRVAA